MAVKKVTRKHDNRNLALKQISKQQKVQCLVKRKKEIKNKIRSTKPHARKKNIVLLAA